MRSDRVGYPKVSSGRLPIGLKRMLRIRFIQRWFNLADLPCEEALYGSFSLCRFVGIKPGREPVPDATAVLKFRRLPNDNQLGEALFAQVGKELQARGFKVNTGTTVDATIQLVRPAPPRMQTKRTTQRCTKPARTQQWYFGMKLYISVDSQTGLTHSAVVTAANVQDSKAPKAKDFTNQRTRRGGIVNETLKAKNRNKSRIRSRAEHVFSVVKRLWGFGKVRYPGLAKSATRAFTALALANIYLSRQRLMAQVRP